MKTGCKVLSGVSLSALISTTGVVTAAPAAVAAPAPQRGDHCLVEALPAEMVDDGASTKELCFSSFAEVAEHLGAGDAKSLKGLTPQAFATEPQFAAASSNTLAIHWNFVTNPGSITITGGQCDGGGLNLSSAWDNRIEATIHKGCGTIKHWDGNNYTGDMEQTQGGWDQNVWLDPLKNRTNSIKYYA